MARVLAKAVTTTTDLGEFRAVAAAWTPDRERDRIRRGAFRASIQRWRSSGKKIPLHWDHQGDPENIIGTIDPASMEETDEGLIVAGELDLAGSDRAREAWRVVKSGAAGLSLGYQATGHLPRPGGGRDLFELDVFEISITPAPMHPDTRILDFKSQDGLRSRVRDEYLDLQRGGNTQARREHELRRKTREQYLSILTDGVA